MYVHTHTRGGVTLQHFSVDVHPGLYCVRTRAIPSYYHSGVRRTVALVFRRDAHVSDVVDYLCSCDRTGKRALPCCHSAAIMLFISIKQAGRSQVVPTRYSLAYEKHVYKRKSADS